MPTFGGVSMHELLGSILLPRWDRAPLVYAGTAVLGILIALVLNKLTQSRRSRQAGKTLPGPPGLPLLGHSLALASPTAFRALQQWSVQYGGAFRLSQGPLRPPLVVLSDPDAVHAVLALDEQHAVKSRRYYGSLEQVLHPSAAAPTMATSPSARHWRPVRRALLHAFSGRELAQDVQVVVSKALTLASIVVGLGPGVVLDVDDAARRISLDTLALSKLGYDCQCVEAEGEVLLLRLLGEVAAEGAARRRRWAGPRLAPWLSDAAAEGSMRLRILHDFVRQELWADIEARGPPPPEEVSLAAQLYRLRHPPTRLSGQPPPPESGLSAAAVAAELAAALLLGHGPVGHSIAWCLGQLAAHPLAQERLVAELRREGVYDKPHTLTYDKLAKLPYLDCVVRETLRLFPPVACPATARTLKQDCSAGGWLLPAGCDVWVDVRSMHRSPTLWRDPERFNPDRWRDATGARAAVHGSTAGVLPYDGLHTVEAAPGDDGEHSVMQEEGAKPPPLAAGAQELKEAGGAAGKVEEGGVSGGAAGQGAGEEPPLCSPRAFMPFGAGARSCLGQQLGVVEVKAAVAVLLCFITFEPSDAAGDVPEVCQELFLMPKGGLHLMVHPRDRSA